MTNEINETNGLLNSALFSPEIPNLLWWLDKNTIYSEERETHWKKFALNIGFTASEIEHIIFNVQWKSSPTAYILKKYRDSTRVSLKQLIDSFSKREATPLTDTFLEPLLLSLVKHWCQNRQLPPLDQIFQDPQMDHEIGKTILVESEIMSIFISKFDKQLTWASLGRNLGYKKSTLSKILYKIRINYSPAKLCFKLWKNNKNFNKLILFNYDNFIESYLVSLGGWANVNSLIAIIYNCSNLQNAIQDILFNVIIQNKDIRCLTYPILRMDYIIRNISNEISPDPKSDPNQLECTICMDGQKNMLLFPCKHLSCCENCSLKISTCPICRSHITKKMRIHLS